MHFLLILSLLSSVAFGQGKERRERRPEDPLNKRVASIFLSETFTKEQLAKHLAKSELIKSLKADFDAESDNLYLRGLLQLPLDDYQAMGIDPSIAQFKFQLTVKPRISRRGSFHYSHASIRNMHVRPAFAEQFYHLRGHIDYVRRLMSPNLISRG